MLFEIIVCTIYHANQKSGRYVLRYNNSVKKMFQHKKINHHHSPPQETRQVTQVTLVAS